MSRTVLAENIPLSHPLSVRLDINNYCNLKCEFCSVSIKKQKPRNMSFETLKSVVDDIASAFGQVDTILFTSQGEPLLHPELCKMIAYAHASRVLKSSKIITNGVLLTHEMSDRLIDAGVSFVQFSINGLSDADYFRNCNANCHFDSLLEQIGYFYTHKKDTVVYTKILNYMVRSQAEKDLFFKLFSPISDSTGIEPLWADDNSTINFDDFAVEEATQYRNIIQDVTPRQICHFPFFNLTITLDGDITPCCFKDRNIIGNISDVRLGNLWHGAMFDFQRKMLDGIGNVSAACKSCTTFYSKMQEEDVLDSAAESCRQRYDFLASERDNISAP